MRVAAVDIGTNSVRLALGEVTDGHFICEEKKVNTTRLGEGTITTDRLGEEPMRRTLEAVAAFRREALEGGYTYLGAYATSAVREAPNRDEFCRMADAFGAGVEVLSGEEESAIAFGGATDGADGICAVADIGGGSTELSYGVDGTVSFGQSARVGAVRMKERFANDDGSFDAATHDELFAYLCETLRPIGEQIPREAVLFGVGGTFTTLCAMQRVLHTYDRRMVQGYRLSRESLTRFSNELCTLPLETRLHIPGLRPTRADIIPAAAVIAEAVLEVTGQKEIVISERDGLEGYVERVVRNGFSCLTNETHLL